MYENKLCHIYYQHYNNIHLYTRATRMWNGHIFPSLCYV